MGFGGLNTLQEISGFGATLARTAMLRSRPAFELQFHKTQEAVLDRLDAELDAVRNSVSTDGLTALLRVQISRQQNDLADINAFKARADKKAERIEQTLSAIAELITLADPTTVTEFDAKLAEAISLMETTDTPMFEQYGVQDRLRAAKTDGLAQLNALVHNNFATQTDIDNVTATLTAIQTDYQASQSINESNTKIAFTLQDSLTDSINELSRQRNSIKTEALGDATARVKEKQKQFGQILTALSLSFEASQQFADFVTQSVALPQEVEPGSVLNLFS